MTERITVEAEWDAEVGVWIAAAPSIGLFTEAETLDALKKRVVVTAADLLGGAGGPPASVSLLLNVALDRRVDLAA